HCAIDTGDKLQLTTPTHGSLTTLLHSARLPVETPSHFIKCSLKASEEQFIKSSVRRNQDLHLRNLLIVIIPIKSSHSQTKLSILI
ncbi:unnamed protein product, partial [Citrullus colocynthis]